MNLKITIDGHELTGTNGQTILEIALENNIDIPTLCHHKQLEHYGSCGICVVEAEGNPRLLRSCSTSAADGMVISTKSARVKKSRKTALELLLSDHIGDCRPPCSQKCPAETDCQGYVGLIANGRYKESYDLIREKLPFPASIGRVCPHPCEDACRRSMVEEPIAIAALKQFAGDTILLNGNYDIQCELPEDTGKRIAIIGGGPGGLSAAYFLRKMGHGVTIYDAMPKMGGMLMYGIPEYRLPKDILQREIDLIHNMGVEFINNKQIGNPLTQNDLKEQTAGNGLTPDDFNSNLTLDDLRNKYDAVIIAAGAWTSTGLRCPGEDLAGVVGGINFLLDVAVGNIKQGALSGRKVAIVGGGNTAMDACRTAVRLGAETVYNIYRRTREEMPAEEIEINEAEEEGVIFRNLVNPIEVIGNNGHTSGIRLQVMELGEKDASGRRAPVPVEGCEELLDIDMLIIAIGQKLNPKGFESVEKTKWGTLSADSVTFTTNIDGVFAIGDATNRGADIAISAIGEAKNASAIIDKYLNGEELTGSSQFLSKTEKSAEDFTDYEKSARTKIPHRSPDVRNHDFKEVNLPMSEDEARREAHRCLECGCMDYFECKLLQYANEYDIEAGKYAGDMHHSIIDDSHPFILRNPNKCILCGLCVRLCENVVGATALGLTDRGFDAQVKPALDTRLQDTGCIACGQCAANCPTGALTEKLIPEKQVPLKETFTEHKCKNCSVGCKVRVAKYGETITRYLPVEGELLCAEGRFGRDRLKAEGFDHLIRGGEHDNIKDKYTKDGMCVLNNRDVKGTM